jgi:hypothetical protein
MADANFDIIVSGFGPGGYVAAIRVAHRAVEGALGAVLIGAFKADRKSLGDAGVSHQEVEAP